MIDLESYLITEESTGENKGIAFYKYNRKDFYKKHVKEISARTAQIRQMDLKKASEAVLDIAVKNIGKGGLSDHGYYIFEGVVCNKDPKKLLDQVRTRQIKRDYRSPECVLVTNIKGYPCLLTTYSDDDTGERKFLSLTILYRMKNGTGEHILTMTTAEAAEMEMVSKYTHEITPIYDSMASSSEYLEY